MISDSFENAFSYQSSPQNECSNQKIDISNPSFAESSEIYRKLQEICADPQALLDLLNIQIVNHVRSGSPEHYTNFELSQMLNPFFSILPYVLSDRSIIAQAHNIIIHVNEFLSNWQNFSFQCFFLYFYQILSSKIYIGKPRKWIINTIFDLLSKNKTVYSNYIITKIHSKDKQFKDKTALHAVISPDQTIRIYHNNTCLKKCILQYIPNDDFPIHQVVEMNDKKEITYKSRITFLDSDGEKTTSDSADRFFREGHPIYQLIWACLSCKRNEFSFESLDVISRMMIDYRGTFLHIFYYSKQMNNIFKSLFTVSVFIHRHTFLLKTLIWAIYDEAVDKNKLFKSPFPAVKYLISFVRFIILPQITTVIDEIIQFIDMHEFDIDAIDSSDHLNDNEFKAKIIHRFWEVLNQISRTFPKSLFDICFQLKIYSTFDQKSGKVAPNPVKDLLFSEVIIPVMFENLTRRTSKNQKDCLNFVIKSITLTAASNKDDEFSRFGFQPLQDLIAFISQDTSGLNIKDIEMPHIQEYIDSVFDLIDCIKGSVEYLRKTIPCNDNDCVSTSANSLDDASADSSQSQLPITRTRSSRISTGNLASLKESESSSNHLQPFKEIPTDIFPWKNRIVKEIFYSYFYTNNRDEQNQSQSNQ